MAKMNGNPMDGLIVHPNQRTLTLSEVLHRMRDFINRIPSVDFVIIVHRKGDAMDQLACTRSAERHVTREILRSALQAFDKDGGVLGGGTPS